MWRSGARSAACAGSANSNVRLAKTKDVGRRIPIHRLLKVDNNAFCLRVLVKPFDAAFPAHAAGLHPAPRERGIDAVMVVDPHDAALKAFGELHSLGGIRSPNRSSKS